MDTTRLRELLAASEAVSPGPWTRDGWSVECRVGEVCEAGPQDAALIVELRNCVPALLAAAEAVERCERLAADLAGPDHAGLMIANFHTAKRIREALAGTDGGDGGTEGRSDG